jgi:hypothetical protein
MLPQSQLPRVLRFGTFEVDVPAGELRKNGLKLKMQEQPFQVLWLPENSFAADSGQQTRL